MQHQDSDTRFDNLISMVIVCAQATHSSDSLREQVVAALDRAGMDCAVLPGQSPSPAVARCEVGLQLQKPIEGSRVEFSVVVPVYNEEGNIAELHRRLTKVMTGLEEPYELVFVDDGSRDGSLAQLRETRARDAQVRVISLARNFGHQQAVSAGLDHARGRAVIVMDADLQDPPEVIPQFIEKWRAGIQVVYAVREKRKERLAKRLLYRSFYLILKSVSRIEIPLEAGDFCLMDRCVVDVLTSLPERNRFIRGLRSWAGFKQQGLAYERDARFSGKSKYTFGRLTTLALEGLISFSYLPLRAASILGFAVSGVSLLLGSYYLVKAVTQGLNPPGFATMVVLILFLGGVQLITIGVIGEYIGHVLDEVKGRPAYVVRDVMQRAGNRSRPGVSSG
jgi:glycosyltransferase involved in cell wall biosynthesis